MVDVLQAVKTLLSSNWSAANTDNITPEFLIISEQRVVPLGNNDAILVYEADEGETPFGIGGKSFHEEPLVTIDIRTTYKLAAASGVRAHLTKLKDEVKRIVRANTATPGNGYRLILIRRSKDLSDKTTGVGRRIIDVHLDRFDTIA